MKRIIIPETSKYHIYTGEDGGFIVEFEDDIKPIHFDDKEGDDDG